ncbi:MAG TPA: short-chain dehydrogenase [Hyphomonadaceae bacterium]|nr:short-chain dehydrogenase [Hyphomonadaceae bacterium]
MSLEQLFGLTGKRALITGGATGIGRAIAAAFVCAGAEVTIVGDREDDLNETAHDLSVHSIHLRLGTRDASEHMVADAKRIMGGTDIFISNAGIEGPISGLMDLDEDAYLAAFDVNLHAANWASAALIPDMAAQGGGSFIFMSSLCMLRGNKAIATYSMTKAALAQLARNIAVAHGPENIRANAIAPGLIETPFARGLMQNAEFMARRMQATPLRRVGQPEEIAAAALWLAGPGGAFTTGQTITVDGGTLIHDGS